MFVTSTIQRVFGYFQNLNLLILIEDLRKGQAVRNAWASGAELCPVAHGLPDGQHVKDLAQCKAVELDESCERAARGLGADSAAVLRFVSRWDGQAFKADWLLWQLEELWLERLEDAEAVQALLVPIPTQATCAS